MGLLRAFGSRVKAIVHRASAPRKKPPPVPLADRLTACLREIELGEAPQALVQELLQSTRRLVERDVSPGAAQWKKAFELADLLPEKLARIVELLPMPPADLLIINLRLLEREKSLPAVHFQEVVHTILRMATVDPWQNSSGAAELNRAIGISSMPPADRMIAGLRLMEEQETLPATHFQELVQSVLRMARRDRTLPGAAELNRALELDALSPADRLMLALNQIELSGEMPPAHFTELLKTVFRLVKADPARDAEFGGKLIAAAQDAIVRNLAQTVIAGEKFLVVDVGAHDGWFIDRILEEPRDIHLIAFEPMPEMESELAKRKARWPDIETFLLAIGDAPGNLQLKVYPKIPGLSSLLDFETDYRYFNGYFDPGEVHITDVPVVTLDDHFRGHTHLADYANVALKIDVQGFEDRVLRGATELLDSGRVKAILIELVTRPKYTGSWDYLTLLRFLDERGFVLYDVNPFYREIGMHFQPTPTGRLTEMDCLFVKADYLDRNAAKTA